MTPAGGVYPCPPGTVPQPTAASTNNVSDGVCCRPAGPQLGVCEVQALQPVLYAPHGTREDLVPMLVLFPNTDSRELFCPISSLGGEEMNVCTLRLDSLSLFEGNEAAEHSSAVEPVHAQLSVGCTGWTPTSCTVSVPLPGGGRWRISLLPAVPQATLCGQTTLLSGPVTEVIDAHLLIVRRPYAAFSFSIIIQ
jgi:hypothetical protein